MTQTAANPAKYQPQMDGLRAVAVLAVLLHHFEGPFNGLFNFGTLGVRFFFVLSGFLITRLLLKARHRYETGETSWQQEWGHFQMRRLIRTLPVYYLSLFIAALLAIPPVRESLFWTLSFLTNFYIARLGYFPDTISHFWSLAVQEQFYLFWPFLIFFLRKNWIKYCFASLIFISLGFRFLCIQMNAPDVVRWFSLPGSLDCFAVGGTLAYISLTKPRLMVRQSTRIGSGILAAGAIFLASRLRYLPLQNPLTIWIEFLEAAAMGWLVACSVAGFGGWLGRCLSWRPITYVGQISYGIYVYHILIAIVLHPFFVHYGISAHSGGSGNIRFFVQLIVTIFCASLSWHWIEKPIIQARERIIGWFLPKPILIVSEACRTSAQ